jgi:hypothetical protein
VEAQFGHEGIFFDAYQVDTLLLEKGFAASKQSLTNDGSWRRIAALRKYILDAYDFYLL